MWNTVQVSMGSATVRGRYRVEGDMLVLEWRGGRLAERFGILKPEVVATQRLKREAQDHLIAA